MFTLYVFHELHPIIGPSALAANVHAEIIETMVALILAFITDTCLTFRLQIYEVYSTKYIVN